MNRIMDRVVAWFFMNRGYMVYQISEVEATTQADNSSIATDANIHFELKKNGAVRAKRESVWFSVEARGSDTPRGFLSGRAIAGICVVLAAVLLTIYFLCPILAFWSIVIDAVGLLLIRLRKHGIELRESRMRQDDHTASPSGGTATSDDPAVPSGSDPGTSDNFDDRRDAGKSTGTQAAADGHHGSSGGKCSTSKHELPGGKFLYDKDLTISGIPLALGGWACNGRTIVEIGDGAKNIPITSTKDLKFVNLDPKTFYVVLCVRSH